MRPAAVRSGGAGVELGIPVDVIYGLITIILEPGTCTGETTAHKVDQDPKRCCCTGALWIITGA